MLSSHTTACLEAWAILDFFKTAPLELSLLFGSKITYLGKEQKELVHLRRAQVSRRFRNV